MTQKFSVIITTYDVPEYLLECLNSFSNFDNIEILVGIDGCEKTKNVIANIEKKENIRFFYFTENCGTYVVKNNLIKETNEDVILFFDSDDIALTNILDRYNSKYDIINLKFDEFGGKKNNIEIAQGVFFIKKLVLDKLVGFENWVCNADVEFKLRAKHNRLRIKEDNVISFSRRKHTKNLTINKETNMVSDIRKTYRKIIREKNNKNNWTNPEIKQINYYEL